ncbi:MAG: Cof-type HAD-IIB family hydrolase [Oscillospiraceae bacterium]|nr:Cof-type HAD-IIB family hydrolase [Oscillospiraceae bacterium]MDE6839482.1 Cof-type HAD-IIB family hydrolase [Oscillospiraceae bacterium]
MIKAIFFDVDGTLVSFAQKFLPDQLLADLPALRERGIKIMISTGRALQDLENTGMLRGVEFDGYVTLNGQYCCDADGTAYRDAPICLEDLRGAYEVLKANPQLPALMEGSGESYLTQINDRVREVYEFLHTQLYPVRDPAWLLEGKVYQFVPLVTPEEEELFLAAMPHCVRTRWHSEGIDIVPRDGGKGVGVRAAMERYGLAREEVMAFGDGDNDAGMLELAGVSVAMGNGSERIKAMAHYVTDTVENGGIAKALRHFGLLPE